MDEAMMGAAPSGTDMIRMLAEQVAGGLGAAQAQISGAEDMVLQALMMAAEAVGSPAPGAGAFFEGAPADAEPGMLAAAGAMPPPGAAPIGAAPPMPPMGAPGGGSPDEAAMLAALLGGAA